MATTDLAPIHNKIMYPTFQRYSRPDGPSRTECWGADTQDGLWRFQREDAPGTPWTAWRLDKQGNKVRPWVDTFGSLRACRIDAAAGWLQAEWERQQRELRNRAAAL